MKVYYIGICHFCSFNNVWLIFMLMKTFYNSHLNGGRELLSFVAGSFL